MKQYQHVDELQRSYQGRKERIRQRLNEYAAVPEQQYFYELVYCLMTPQSSAVNAGKAQKEFEQLGLLVNDVDPEPVLFNKEHYIRFHHSKAEWIREMKGHFPEILSVTIGELPAFEKREWFVKNVKGLSYKEATHFLRNIGKNNGLTILDRHILKNLKQYGVIRSIPSSLTRKHYYSIEKKFTAFAQQVGISVDELDLLFWSNETGEILK
ncbi:MAG: N-glycosylase/DNA lyase [Bacteroidota bacterium]